MHGRCWTTVGSSVYPLACPHTHSFILWTMSESSKMPYALSRLATDTLCAWPHLFSIYQILPLHKNPRHVPVSPWNLCRLLPLPPTSILTEQVHFFTLLSHHLAINYILSCSLQGCLLPHADTISDMEINPIFIQTRTRKSSILKEMKLLKRIEALINSNLSLLQFLYMSKKWCTWPWRTIWGRWWDPCGFTLVF